MSSSTTTPGAAAWRPPSCRPHWSARPSWAPARWTSPRGPTVRRRTGSTCGWGSRPGRPTSTAGRLTLRLRSLAFGHAQVPHWKAMKRLDRPTAVLLVVAALVTVAQFVSAFFVHVAVRVAAGWVVPPAKTYMQAFGFSEVILTALSLGGVV